MSPRRQQQRNGVEIVFDRRVFQKSDAWRDKSIDRAAEVGRDRLFGTILLCFRPRRGGLAANAN
jgi:hypothetical protein